MSYKTKKEIIADYLKELKDLELRIDALEAKKQAKENIKIATALILAVSLVGLIIWYP